MTSDLPALALPSTDWEGWLAQRCDSALAEVRSVLEVLTAATPDRSAAAVLELWNDLNLALANAFAVASVLSNVHPEEAVRTRGEQAEQVASRLSTAIELDRSLYEVLAGLDMHGLDEDARRVHALTVRDFQRAGVDRDDAVRERLGAIADRETVLGQEFGKNIRDGVRSISVAPESLDGLPEDFVAGHPTGDDGRVVVTTDYPDLIPFLTFARDREARAALNHEFANRAWPENEPLLHELLELRREHAALLGYDGWPAYDAEVKMIGSGAAIPAFVDRIAAVADAVGRADLDDLLRRVQQDHPEVTEVTRADKDHYLELLRRERCEVDAQQVRGYFDFGRVRDGLLAVTGRLFDVEYVEVADAPTWHGDVTTYDVRRGGRRLGRIHLDLHPRPGKYGHAAQFSLTPGLRDRQLAEGVLVCNFSRSLMEHSHVVTLFHEFGHLLHHVLAGEHEWVRFSGVATEWDFVEAPSQMLEQWAWDTEVLQSFALDAAGKPIPGDLVQRMRAADELGKGLHVRTQMFYAALSYHLHQDVPADITATMRELQARYDLLAYAPGTHFYASFGHLHGYGSGYYTYMWSLVIAKDLLSAFDRDDLFGTEVAHRYRDRVLAPGGSRDAADLVADFLGRPYDIAAFEAWLSPS